MKEILVTVCGRGGSKGILNKNVRLLCGVPLVAWTLFDADRAFEGQSDVQKTIVVDSDSEAILENAHSFCPDVWLHKRKESLAGDRVSKIDVLREVLKDISIDAKRKFDAVVDLDITSPLRTTEDIERAYKVFDKGKYEVVFSVVPARRNPYFNMVEMNDSGRFTLSKSSNFVARQEAPKVFDMNASIYIYKPEVFQTKVKSPTCLDFGIYEMVDYGVIDIDTENDLALMELILIHGERLIHESLNKKRKNMTSLKKHISGEQISR